MKDFSGTEFRRQCLSSSEKLPEKGIIITKHGCPVAPRKGERVILPLLTGKGQPEPLCPDTETPYNLVFD